MRFGLTALLALTLGACQCGGPPVEPGEGSPPTAAIHTPEDGAELAGPGPFTLEGSGNDPEDGTLSGAALLWTSDLEGPLGEGTSLRAALRPGTHRLSLDAWDSDGLRARAQISVTVLEEAIHTNAPPAVSISAPPAGTLVDQGVAIAVTGTAEDPEDGVLSGMSLVWTSDRQGMLGTGGSVTFQSVELGTHTLLLTATDSEGAAGYASLTLEVVLPGENRPPVVTISSPTNGAQFVTGNPVSLVGSANDPEDGALAGAQLSWSSSRDGALGTGGALTLNTLSQGTHVLTLTATDSLDLTANASVTISVNAPNNLPPTASITTPANGHSVFEGTAISFTASASDPEDGALSGAALVWSSDRDGALGSGSPLSTSSLSVGPHRIQLTATDSGGNSATAGIDVTILKPNAAPTVSITSPATGSSYTAGTTVPFRGTASDPEDGALTGASLTWRSDRDGILGTGVSLDTASLSVGAHTITLTAIDSGGRSASSAIGITVQAAPVNLAPIARLTGPSQAIVGATVLFDGATSGDSDGTITAYRFDFGDGTPPQTGASSSATHAFASMGTFTVTLTVTDDGGLTGTTSLTVSVTSDTRVPSVIEQRVGTSLGSMCQIEAVGGKVFIAFREQTHPSLWLGVLDGMAWSTELVDGPGFTVGGLVWERFAMTADSAGALHFAYLFEPDSGPYELNYAARPAGGTWTRERVDSAYSPQAIQPGLALNPTQGNRPTILFSSFISGTGTRSIVASRSAPGTWTETRLTFGSTSNSQSHRGELSFDSSGTLYFPYLSQLGAWDGTTTSYFSLGAALPTWVNTAWRAPGQLLLMSGSGLLDVTLGSPLSMSSVTISSTEAFDSTQQGVAADASGLPRVLVKHGSELELLTLDADGFWSRESLGETDNAGVDLTVDAAGRTRACFFRAGKLILY